MGAEDRRGTGEVTIGEQTVPKRVKVEKYCQYLIYLLFTEVVSMYLLLLLLLRCYYGATTVLLRCYYHFTRELVEALFTMPYVLVAWM